MEYETKDFMLVCYLTYIGYPSSMRKEGKECWFKFTNMKQEDMDAFWNGQATVEPKSFYSTISQVKSRLYS